MSKPIDTIAEKGIQKIQDLDYVGNFTIKFYSKEDLELLHAFFGVRGQKFDMRLLEKRPELLKALKGFQY